MRNEEKLCVVGKKKGLSALATILVGLKNFVIPIKSLYNMKNRITLTSIFHKLRFWQTVLLATSYLNRFLPTEALLGSSNTQQMR